MPIRYLLPCLIFFAIDLLTILPLSAQPVTLLSQDGITVFYEALKIETTKKNDVYQINVTVQTPAEDRYFTTLKGMNVLQDLAVGRYLQIEFTNHTGFFEASNKFIKAAPANLITTDNAMVYRIPSGATMESFTIHVQAGASPEIRATLLVPVQSINNLSLVRASEAERFAGTSPTSKMFLLYEGTDTLLAQRDNIIRFINRNHVPSQATYANNQFIIRRSDAKQDSLTVQFDYLNWSNNIQFVRITGDSFDLSKTKDFKESKPTRYLQFKDADGRNHSARIERTPRNILVANVMMPKNASTSSENGKYSLRLATDGILKLFNNENQQPVWSNLASAAPNGLAVMIVNDQYVLRMMKVAGQTGMADEQGSFLTVGNDGNLKMYRSDGLAVWQSNTGEH